MLHFDLMRAVSQSTSRPVTPGAAKTPNPYTGSISVNPSTISNYAAWAYVIFAVLVVFWDLVYISRNYAKLPFGDHWMWLAELFTVGPWKVLYNQFNEHRLTIPGLVYLADFYWFSGSNQFSLIISMLIQFGCVGLIVAPLSQVRSVPKPMRYVFAGFVAITMFWFIQGENFFFVFSLCMGCANFGIMAALYLFARFNSLQNAAGSKLQLAGVVFFGIWANYSYGHGILIWPVLLIMCLLLRVPWRYFTVIGIGFLLSVGVYFFRFARSNVNLVDSLRHPVRFARYVVFMMALPFIGPSAQDVTLANHPVSLVASVSGIVLGLVYLFRFVLTRSEHRQIEQVFYHALMMLSLGSVLLTALNRSSAFSAEQALSGRYAPVPLMFWLSLIALTTVYLARLEPVGGFGRPIWCALLVVASISTLALQSPVGFYLSLVSRMQDVAAASIEVGVPDMTQVQADLQPVTDVVFLVDRKEKMELNRTFFWRPEEKWLGTAARQHFPASGAGTCIGTIDSMAPLSSPIATGVKVVGWAWNTSERRPLQRIWVTDAQEIVRGFGVTRIPRPDVTAAYANPDMMPAGWIAYAKVAPQSGALTIYADAGEGTTVCEIGAPRVPTP